MRRYRELQTRHDGPQGSSWGEWGADDEMGTLNFIGPEQIVRAASLVRRGAAFNLDLPLTALDPPLLGHREPVRHTIFQLNEDHRDDRLDSFFMQASSQIDGLRHFRHFQHGWYNGMPQEAVAAGSPTLGIGRWADRGIAGRGVIIDVARYLAGSGTDAGEVHAYPVSLIEEVARHQGVELRSGDMLLLHTGWLQGYLSLGDQAKNEARKALRCPGLLQSHDTLEWLWDHQIALVAADNLSVECWPPVADSPFVTPAERSGAVPPTIHTGLMHRALIPLLGFCLGELWHMEALASDCAADGVWEAFVTVKPLNVVDGVGSPANALAIK